MPVITFATNNKKKEDAKESKEPVKARRGSSKGKVENETKS